MNQNELHLGRVATIVVPVTDHDAALAFYVGVLGMEKVNDLMYPTGERWLEVSPAEGSSNLCLVIARPDRPVGIETGVVLLSTDVLDDLAVLRGRGVDVDETPLPQGQVVWWSGAPLAGVPPSSAYVIPTATRSWWPVQPEVLAGSAAAWRSTAGQAERWLLPTWPARGAPVERPGGCSESSWRPRAVMSRE